MLRIEAKCVFIDLFVDEELLRIYWLLNIVEREERFKEERIDPR